MAQIRVQPSALSAGGRQLAEQAGVLHQLSAQADGIPFGGLTGNGVCEAALADFAATWASFVRELGDTLQSFGEATAASAEVYADTDRKAFRAGG